MSSERLRVILMTVFRCALWFPVIQTVLWLLHGGRDGTFAEWSIAEIGPVGDLTAFFVLTIMFTGLILVPLIIAISDHRAVRWFTFVCAAAFVYLSAQDWLGTQTPFTETPYQAILKVGHNSMALLALWFGWKWARAKS